MEKRWGEGERVSQTTEHSDLEEIKNPHSSVGKESACSAGDPSLIPGSGGSTGERLGYPLLYSGLENSMDSVVQTRLSDFHFHFVFPCCDTSGLATDITLTSLICWMRIT